MFAEAPNMNTNPLPNHITSSEIINALEIKGFRTLKVSMDEIYKILIKDGYMKSGCEIGLMNESFASITKRGLYDWSMWRFSQWSDIDVNSRYFVNWRGHK